MQTTRVTASEFQQAFGALSDKARHKPVVITKHGRDSLVVMSAMERAGPGSPPSAMDFPSPMPNTSHYCNGIQSPNRPPV